jgi:hypothetical protein
LEIFLHLAAQLEVGVQLGRLGPAGALIGERMRPGGSIASAPTRVARQLATDRRRAAPQPPGDRPHRLTRRAPDRDLLALGERQTPTLQIPPAARTHTTLRGQPPSALLAIRAGLGRRGRDELATRHRRPEHPHNLRNHPVRKPRHSRLRSPSQQENLAGPRGSRPDSAPIATKRSPSGSASRRPACYSTTELR